MAKQANNNVFVVDDGTREIKLENTFHEEICTLRLRLSDIGIVDRYNDMVNHFQETIASLKDISFNADGTASFMQDWDLLKRVEKEVIDQINVLFDFKDAEKIFKTRNAFSSVNGKFFVEEILTVLGQVIHQNVEAEAEKAQQRTAKYTEDLDADEEERG